VGWLVVALLAPPAPSVADPPKPGSNLGPMGQELFGAPDFRVRVSAALALGKQRPAGARASLERALQDPHPAVRTAVASALSVLADPAAAPALERAAAREQVAPVKARMTESVEGLRRGRPAFTLEGKQLVVQVGRMTNDSGATAPEIEGAMAAAARAEVSHMRTAAVVEATDTDALAKARARRLPIVVLDGRIDKLSVAPGEGGALVITAHVELRMQRGGALRGTLSGGASVEEREGSPGEDRLRDLRARVVAAAVEGALRGAEKGLQAAAK
jgi:hypothetical protein